MSDEQPMVGVPDLCEPCQRTVVEFSGWTEDDPWMAGLIVVNVALFQACTRDRRVWERAGGGKLEDLTIVLAEIGCLGCFKPNTLRAIGEAFAAEGFGPVAQRIRTEAFPDHDPPDP